MSSPFLPSLFVCLVVLLVCQPSFTSAQAVGTYLGWYFNEFLANTTSSSGGQAANDLHCHPIQQYNNLPPSGVPLVNFQASYSPTSVPFPAVVPGVRMALYTVNSTFGFNFLAGTALGHDMVCPYSRSAGVAITQSTVLQFNGTATGVTLLPFTNYSLCVSFTAGNLSTIQIGPEWSVPAGSAIQTLAGGYAFEPFYPTSPYPNPYPVNATKQGTGIFQVWMNGNSTSLLNVTTPPSSAVVPAFPLLEPSAFTFGEITWYMMAQPQTTPGQTGIFIFDSSFSVLYAMNGAGVVTAQQSNIGPLNLFYFETRPQAQFGVVWLLMSNLPGSYPDYYDSTTPNLAAFNLTTLAMVHYHTYQQMNFNPPSNMSLGYSFLATDSHGLVYIAQGNQVYTVNGTTGAQVGYFSVPVPDAAEYTTSFNLGYFIGFDPSDVLWLLDSNALPDGSLSVWRTTKTGSIINQVNALFPGSIAVCQLNCYPQSFAVDSTGIGYVTLYTLNVVYKLNSQLQFITAIGPAIAYPAFEGYDLETAISWGPTPAQDLVYTVGYFRPPVLISNTSGSLVSILDITPIMQPLAFTYDPFLNSYLVANSDGVFSVNRLNTQGQVIGHFYLGFNSDDVGGNPIFVYGIATDGTGYSAFAGTASDGMTQQLWLFRNYTQVWVLQVGQAGAVAIDPINQLIWVPNTLSGHTLEAYSFATGALVRTVSSPAALAIPNTMLFHNGSIFQCDAVTSVISAVALTTGAVSVVYSGYSSSGVGPQAVVYSFAFSADWSVLYIAGLSAASPYGSVWSVATATGSVIEEFDVQSQPVFLVAANTQSGVVAVPDSSAFTTTGMFVFPAVSTATASATASLCFLLYSVPGNVDYPWSSAIELSFQYTAIPATSGLGTHVTLLSGSGTRTYTNRYGQSSTIALQLSPQSNNFLYLNSPYPVDTSGLSFAMASPVQLPGAGPTTLYSVVNVANVSGAVIEVNGSRVDNAGSAFMSTVPGFNNIAIGASNINTLAVLYPTCQAPITFTNGLRIPPEPSSSNGAVHIFYSLFISDGVSYAVQLNLTVTMASAFANSKDLLGNQYQSVLNATGSRLYTYFSTGATVKSTVTGLSSSGSPQPSQRFYPYSLLSSAPGVYTTNTAPLVDAQGLGLNLSPAVPQLGSPPSSTTLYSSTIIRQVAPANNVAYIAEGVFTTAPNPQLQQQIYQLLQ